MDPYRARNTSESHRIYAVRHLFLVYFRSCIIIACQVLSQYQRSAIQNGCWFTKLQFKTRIDVQALNLRDEVFLNLGIYSVWLVPNASIHVVCMNQNVDFRTWNVVSKSICARMSNTVSKITKHYRKDQILKMIKTVIWESDSYKQRVLIHSS